MMTYSYGPLRDVLLTLWCLHHQEDKVELDEEEEQESLLTAEGSHALPPSRVSNNKRALQAELGRLQRALEDERTKVRGWMDGYED